MRAAGYTRVSLGMQSVAPHVLATLDRVHSPGRALDAAREARAAGFEHVNLDLIYGTPGETDDDLLRSVDAAIEAGVDHISAYALIVEEGTALARRVRRGEIPLPTTTCNDTSSSGARDFAAAHPAGQRGAVLDDQRVAGHMVDACVDRRVDGAAQVVVGLPRRAIDQVEVDVVEAGAAGFARRVERPARRVHPVEHRQHVRRHRLHAKRHPRVARRPQSLEEVRRRGLGVGLGGDLGVRGQREVLADRVEHRSPDRRRPAATASRRRRTPCRPAAASPAARPPAPSSVRSASSQPSGFAPPSSAGV